MGIGGERHPRGAAGGRRGGWSLPSGFSHGIVARPLQGTGSSLPVPSDGSEVFLHRGTVPEHPFWVGGMQGGDSVPPTPPLSKDWEGGGVRFLQASTRGLKIDVF